MNNITQGRKDKFRYSDAVLNTYKKNPKYKMSHDYVNLKKLRQSF